MVLIMFCVCVLVEEADILCMYIMWQSQVDNEGELYI